MPQYKPEIAVQKGVTEGGIAGVVAMAITLILRNTGTDLDMESQAAIIGLTTTGVVGLIRWWRNRRKHK